MPAFTEFTPQYRRASWGHTFSTQVAKFGSIEAAIKPIGFFESSTISIHLTYERSKGLSHCSPSSFWNVYKVNFFPMSQICLCARQSGARGACGITCLSNCRPFCTSGCNYCITFSLVYLLTFMSWACRTLFGRYLKGVNCCGGLIWPVLGNRWCIG